MMMNLVCSLNARKASHVTNETDKKMYAEKVLLISAPVYISLLGHIESV
jgi:hypothetical protein